MLFWFYYFYILDILGLPLIFQIILEHFTNSLNTASNIANDTINSFLTKILFVFHFYLY